MNFYFRKTTKDIMEIKEEEKHFENNQNICRLCEKEILPDKVRDHCHLTS